MRGMESSNGVGNYRNYLAAHIAYIFDLNRINLWKGRTIMEIKINKSKTALLVMDMQKNMIDEKSPMAQHAGFAEMVKKTNLVERIRKVMDAAREAGMMVVTIGVDFSTGGFPVFPQRGEFCKAIAAEHDGGEVLRPGTWGYETHERVAPIKGEPVIGKMHMSAFAGSKLDQVLSENGVSDIAMTGVATSFVVTATTWSALNYGYSCIVIEDCCTSGSQESHEMAINAIRPVADICAAEEFIKAIK